MFIAFVLRMRYSCDKFSMIILSKFIVSSKVKQENLAVNPFSNTYQSKEQASFIERIAMSEGG